MRPGTAVMPHEPCSSCGARLGGRGGLLLLHQFPPRSPGLAHALRYRSSLRRCQPFLLLTAPGHGLFEIHRRLNLASLEDASSLAAADGFVATVLTATRFGGAADAISMPNISERSSLASTFAAAGAFRFCARSEPAFAIKSC